MKGLTTVQDLYEFFRSKVNQGYGHKRVDLVRMTHEDVARVIDALVKEAPHAFPSAYDPTQPRDFGDPNNVRQFRTNREVTARTRAAHERNREDIIRRVSSRLGLESPEPPAALPDIDLDREELFRTAPELRDPENRAVMRRWLEGGPESGPLGDDHLEA